MFRFIFHRLFLRALFETFFLLFVTFHLAARILFNREWPRARTKYHLKRLLFIRCWHSKRAGKNQQNSMINWCFEGQIQIANANNCKFYAYAGINNGNFTFKTFDTWAFGVCVCVLLSADSPMNLPKWSRWYNSLRCVSLHSIYCLFYLQSAIERKHVAMMNSVLHDLIISQ